MKDDKRVVVFYIYSTCQLRPATFLNDAQVTLLIYKIFIYLASPSFSCSMGTLSCSMWGLVPWPGITPRSPELGTPSLRHWTSREAQDSHISSAQEPHVLRGYCRGQPRSRDLRLMRQQNLGEGAAHMCVHVGIHMHMCVCVCRVSVPEWGVCLEKMENWGLEQRQRCPVTCWHIQGLWERLACFAQSFNIDHFF